ncbi:MULTISPECIES: phage portal protein family protein [Bizionia]|uniref:DUF935 family protein n=1 Tax=Bizionia algoritergicola TaxID=291187 RepID=A0A5D0QZD9_9FLAO|nr:MULTISPECIES: DUF935 family protein [Bizionia]TYB74577.1 DUF935 family protein [Bizionia algoritergicola]
MTKKKNPIGFQTESVKLAAVKTNATKPKVSPTIIPKAVARIRQDIKSWNRALQLTKLEDNPKWYLYQQLLDEIGLDALLTSQYKNRLLKALKESIILKKPNGEVDQEQTDMLNNAVFTNDINTHILDSIYRAHSLIEFTFNENGVLQVELIPRANVDPLNGVVYPDYTEDKKILYRDSSEYGTWLLEFGKKKDYGLFNSAIPHVLFKRFAQSCWSELCEIYGIPPRYMKTNTQDPSMVKRAERMMTDMGAAAWFIIDESESFEFAKGVSTSGDVYKNLINLCNNEMSLLMSGAVIGQDTQNGSRSKDESGQDMLQTLIDADLQLLEQYWNSSVIPALVNLGVLKGELVYAYEQTEDLETLWKMTNEASQHYDINTEWIKEKFGIDVIGKKEVPKPASFKLDGDFFA